MEVEKIGQAIQFLRKRAGYTQQELSERIMVSDKAVSRWERGVGIPDVSLLRRIAIILDTDIDSLLEGSVATQEESWKGLLHLDYAPETIIFDKPLIDYLLSYFLLARIRDIFIFCKAANMEYIRSRYKDGDQLGISLTYCIMEKGELISDCIQRSQDFYAQSNIMALMGSCILYGADFTRFLHRGMINSSPITALAIVKNDKEKEIYIDSNKYVVKPANCETVATRYHYCLLPMIFVRGGINRITQKRFASYSELISDLIDGTQLSVELLDKGFVDFEVSSKQAVLDASIFISLVQKQTGTVVCCPEEIAYRRGFISSQELEEIANEKNNEYLRALCGR
jgi:dTDP-glucose pyrophosphorylase